MKYILSLLTLILISTCLSFVIPCTYPGPGKTVHLSVDISDTVLKTVNLEEFRNEFFTNPTIKSKKYKNDIDFNFELSAPKLFRFYSLKPQTAPLIIFIQPGDSITYKSGENNFIVFEGKNAGHYNFFATLNNSSLQYKNFDEKEGLKKYKNNIELTYEKRLAFLKEYSKKVQVSKLFIERAGEVLKYECINRKLNRFMIPDAMIINDPCYLDEFDYKIFDRNDQQDNDYFYLALANYLHFISMSNDTSETYSKQKIEFLLRFITENLSGSTQEYALVKTFTEYEKHLKSQNRNFLISAINNSLLTIEEKKYYDALVLIRKKLESIGSELPEDVLDSKLIDISGTSVTFRELLKKNDTNIKVIDFWASWCAPCITEIKKSYQKRYKLSKEKNVVFLYFSIDENPQKWKNKVSDLKGFGMNNNQYLVPKTNTALKVYFSLISIPKYVVLNSTNKTFTNTIPSPGDDEFDTIIKDVK